MRGSKCASKGRRSVRGEMRGKERGQGVSHGSGGGGEGMRRHGGRTGSDERVEGREEAEGQERKWKRVRERRGR